MLVVHDPLEFLNAAMYIFVDYTINYNCFEKILISFHSDKDISPDVMSGH